MAYATSPDQLTALYQEYFGRAPDEGGYNFWLSASEAGWTPDMIAQQFATSPEYLQYQQQQQQATTTTGPNFSLSGTDSGVTQAYEDNPYVQQTYTAPTVTQAPAPAPTYTLPAYDPYSEYSSDQIWELESAGIDPYDQYAAQDYFNSTFAPPPTITTSEAQIRDLYQQYFGRAPDADGLAFWVTAGQQGYTPEMIAAEFAKSPEYLARIAPATTTTATTPTTTTPTATAPTATTPSATDLEAILHPTYTTGGGGWDDPLVTHVTQSWDPVIIGQNGWEGGDVKYFDPVLGGSETAAKIAKVLGFDAPATVTAGVGSESYDAPNYDIARWLQSQGYQVETSPLAKDESGQLGNYVYAKDASGKIIPETAQFIKYEPATPFEKLLEGAVMMGFNALAPGVAQFIQGGMAVDRGDVLGGLAAVTGAGGFTTASTALNFANAVDKGDWLGAISAGMNLAGTETLGGFTSKDFQAANNIVKGIEAGNVSSILAGANNFINSPELSIAAPALQVAQAIANGDYAAAARAGVALNTALQEYQTQQVLAAAYADPTRAQDLPYGTPTDVLPETPTGEVPNALEPVELVPGISNADLGIAPTPSFGGTTAGTTPATGATAPSFKVGDTVGDVTFQHSNQAIAADQVKDLVNVGSLTPGQLNWLASYVFLDDTASLRDAVAHFMKTGEMPVSSKMTPSAMTEDAAVSTPGYQVDTANVGGQFAYSEAGVPASVTQVVEVTDKYDPTIVGSAAADINKALEGTPIGPVAGLLSQAVGEFGNAMIAGPTNWLFNLPPDSKLSRIFNEVSAAADINTPEAVKEGRANWQQRVADAEGIWGKFAAGVVGGLENPAAAAWEISSEILQELPNLGMGLAVKGTAKALDLANSLATKLGVSVATATDMIENGGAAYNDAVKRSLEGLQSRVDSGELTNAQALQIAQGNGAEALLYGMGVTGGMALIPGGNALYKQVLESAQDIGTKNVSDVIAKTLTTGLTTGAKEFASEGVEGGATEATTQGSVYGYDNIDWEDVAAAAGQEALIGGGTAGSIGTIDAGKGNIASAIDSSGGPDVSNTGGGDSGGGGTGGGGGIDLGSKGDDIDFFDGTDKTDQELPPLNQYVQPPLGGNIADTGFSPDTVIATDEDGNALTAADLGLVAPAPVAPAPVATAPVTTTVTPKDVQTIVNNTVASLPPGVTEQQVTQIVSDAVAKVPPGVSVDQVQTIVNTAVGSIPAGLTTQDVQGVVDAAIASIPPGISTADVTKVVEDAINKLPTAPTMDDINGAIKSSVEALGTATADKVAGVEAQVATLSKQTQDALSTLSADTKAQFDTLSDAQKAQADALVQQGVDLTTAINDVAASTSTQIAALSKEMQDALATQSEATKAQFEALTAEQKAQAEALVQQGSDLTTAIADVQGAFESQIANLSADTQAKYDVLSADQKALAETLAQQGIDLTTAIETAIAATQEQITQLGEQTQEQISNLSQQTQGQIASLSTETKAQFDTLTANQQAQADALVQQGIDLDTAIKAVAAETQTQISNLSETTQEKISQLSEATQNQFIELDKTLQTEFEKLTEAQQKEVDERVKMGEKLEDAIITQSDELKEIIKTNVDALTKQMEEDRARAAKTDALRQLQSLASQEDMGRQMAAASMKPGELANVFYYGALKPGERQSAADVTDFQAKQRRSLLGASMESEENAGDQKALLDQLLASIEGQDSFGNINDLMQYVMRG